MSVKSGKRLGMGLSALLGDTATLYKETPEAVNDDEAAGSADSRRLHWLPLEQIHPDARQPRKNFDAAQLRSLSDSLRRQGMLQPLLVSLEPAGADGVARYRIIAGERRWRAAQHAGLRRVPCVLRAEEDEEQRLLLALIENLQRCDLNPLEEAEAYNVLQQMGRTHDEVADALGKSRPHVSNMLRLLALPAAVRNALAEGSISIGHAKALAGAEDPEAVLRLILKNGLSVREAEKAATLRAGAGLTNGRRIDPDLAHAEADLAAALNTKVAIRHKADGSGSVVLHYRNLERFELLCRLLTGEQG